jgi:hypothetical protein
VKDWIDHLSDGIVRLSSARKIPQRTEGPVVIGDEEGEKGSRPMAIRNDENGENILIEIFSEIVVMNVQDDLF